MTAIIGYIDKNDDVLLAADTRISYTSDVYDDILKIFRLNETITIICASKAVDGVRQVFIAMKGCETRYKDIDDVATYFDSVTGFDISSFRDSNFLVCITAGKNKQNNELHHVFFSSQFVSIKIPKGKCVCYGSPTENPSYMTDVIVKSEFGSPMVGDMSERIFESNFVYIRDYETTKNMITTVGPIVVIATTKGKHNRMRFESMISLQLSIRSDHQSIQNTKTKQYIALRSMTQYDVSITKSGNKFEY